MGKNLFKQEYYARIGLLSEVFIGTIILKGGRYFQGGKFEIERNPMYYLDKEGLFEFLRGCKVLGLRNRNGKKVESSQLIKIIEKNNGRFSSPNGRENAVLASRFKEGYG